MRVMTIIDMSLEVNYVLQGRHPGQHISVSVVKREIV